VANKLLDSHAQEVTNEDLLEMEEQRVIEEEVNLYPLEPSLQITDTTTYISISLI
jgi:hypothetical protein